jgi:hypothetical protein
MTAADILATFRQRGIELSVANGKLRYRAPNGALDDDLRRVAADHRAALLALVSAPSVPAWDADVAHTELWKAFAVLDAALSATWLSEAQQNLLAVFRRQVADYHDSHNRQLFGFAPWVEAHVRRWRDTKPA